RMAAQRVGAAAERSSAGLWRRVDALHRKSRQREAAQRQAQRGSMVQYRRRIQQEHCAAIGEQHPLLAAPVQRDQGGWTGALGFLGDQEFPDQGAGEGPVSRRGPERVEPSQPVGAQHDANQHLFRRHHRPGRAQGLADVAESEVLRVTLQSNLIPEFELLAPLRRYWGYDGFRPNQERVVRSLLAGRDVCVVMPTGGGKSLCYQLPALVLGRTAIVVSPLIALMQDQAAQLAQMGIPAAVLNSSMPADQQSQVVRKARAGEYRLLYLSPERLARQDTIGWLRQAPIAFFAIDEAHCISEWGHEFRPEYRQLSALRQRFPAIPIAAFTASATRHVRHDILQQLQLREPDKYIVSFHRPNLRYLVRACDARTQPRLLVQALEALAGSNVIVYAPTIARVD